jgi:nucleotide-binding universal stress UspA family protein
MNERGTWSFSRGDWYVFRKRLTRMMAAGIVLMAVGASATEIKPGADRYVTSIAVTEAIGPATPQYVRDTLLAANPQHAEAVILRLNTPGGLATSMREIIADVLASPVPVIGFVGPRRSPCGERRHLYPVCDPCGRHGPGHQPGRRDSGADRRPACTCPREPEKNKEGGDRPALGSGDAMTAKVTNDAVAFIRSGTRISDQRMEQENLIGSEAPVASGQTGHKSLSATMPCGTWPEDDFVGHYARAFDITVLGRPSNEANQPRPPMVEAALFESGRPVLLVPPTPPSTLGTTAVVAWNRSTETARTIALATPQLTRAQRIVVVDFEDWGVPGPSPQDLSRTLMRNELLVETRFLPNLHGQAGEALLSAAVSLGCDLLVKGTYTQSRLRQFIFGAATSHILSNTAVPVLMAH